MAQYVDGFVLPIPKKNIAAYTKIAKMASKVWIEHGALEYRECVGEDLKPPMGLSFSKLANAKKGETVVFAWIVFKSRAHRDKVNAKVMKDPRMNEVMDDKPMPFDCNMMGYSGFEVIVQNEAKPPKKKVL